jgi:hypothetical protein
MALRTNLFNDNIFEVLEINNMLALRTGHMLSQVPLYKTKYITSADNTIRNGQIVFLDVDGTLAARHKLGFAIGDGTTAIANAADTKEVLKPFIIYNEELMTGPYTDLKYFVEVFEPGNVLAYPRALALNIGDVFTTNNFTGTRTGALFATIPADTGVLTVATALPTGAYSGPLFSCRTIVDGGIGHNPAGPVTLPDGETLAIEFTVIDLNAVFVGS